MSPREPYQPLFPRPRSIREWWERIDCWEHTLVYDGPDYLMLFWIPANIT